MKELSKNLARVVQIVPNINANSQQKPKTKLLGKNFNSKLNSSILDFINTLQNQQNDSNKTATMLNAEKYKIRSNN